jgi:hypothetical protein
MSVDERSRLQLAEAVKRALGDDEGITLMELLPPVGWADVATKHDLLMFEERLDARFERVDARFERVDARFEALDARFERIEARFESLDARFEDVDGRFEGLDARFEGLETRFDAKLEALEYKLVSAMDRGFRDQTWRLVAGMAALLGVFVAALKF